MIQITKFDENKNVNQKIEPNLTYTYKKKLES